MSLPWFRLYRELKDDPKVGALDDFSFRIFIESLCWACEHGDGGLTGLNTTNADWAYRRNVSEPLQKLFECGLLVKKDDGSIFVPAWNKRQMPSDCSTQRVRKYREKNNETLHETFQKHKGNVQEERRGDENRGEDSTRMVASLPRFKKPSIEEIRLQAAKIGLPDGEVDNFWNHYESNGWKVGRNAMKSWTHALTNWKNNAMTYGNHSNAHKPSPRDIGTCPSVSNYRVKPLAQREREAAEARAMAGQVATHADNASPSGNGSPPASQNLL